MIRANAAWLVPCVVFYALVKDSVGTERGRVAVLSVAAVAVWAAVFIAARREKRRQGR